MGRLALYVFLDRRTLRPKMASEEFRVWGHRARDGTWRGRVFVSGQRVWECGHPHASIEDAWRCAERQRDKPSYSASNREQV